MIHSITVINDLNESLKIELSRPEKSGFLITNITGLGPVRATVNMTELATSDGAIDNSARMQTRNIVIYLKFLGHPTIEDTRLLSYKYFPPKKKVTIKITTDNRTCETTGRVELNEPTIFTNDEGCQISIICADPFFYSNKNDITTFYGVDPKFEFPFENNSLTENLIEFGDIRKVAERTVRYNGDAPVGIVIKIHSIGEAKGLAIYNIKARQVMRIDDEKLKELMNGEGIKAGDDIIISTIKGSKGIKMIRSGIETNILNTLIRPINWFQLEKGDNIFAYTVEEGYSSLQFRIESRVLFYGV